MSERFDAVVIGLGPGGDVAAGQLLAAGRRVAVVEPELIGGECAYWACIPSKTLLRATDAAAAAGRVAGLGSPPIDWAALADYRVYMVRHLDDAAQVHGYERQGATVVKGETSLSRRGRSPSETTCSKPTTPSSPPVPSRSSRRSRGWRVPRCGPTGKLPTWSASPSGSW